MKIVQIITGSPSIGGAEAHVRDLATGLVSRGHECVVMAGPPEGLFAEQLRARGVPVVAVPALKKPIHPRWDLLSLVQLTAALRRVRPDVVATHTAKAGFVGRIAANLLGIPCFFTPHGLSFIDRTNGAPIPFRLRLERLALGLNAQMIAVCEAERRLALEWLAIDEARVTTIHNGLPDCVATRQPMERKPIVLTMVARFDVQKDHATLLEALSALRHLDWTLRLAGSGPLLPEVKRMAEEHGLAGRIEFLGECREIPSLLAETDVFLLITNWEAFPISILEAMRAGLPVVATDVGGIAEAIEDGRNGLLVPVRGAKETAHAIERLVRSPELRQQMGACAQERFLRQFVWNRMLDKTEAAYKTALPNPVTLQHSARLEKAKS
jgi:glycosyltransferase involved in cell wall biosynthesis